MVRIGVTQWSVDSSGVETVHRAAALGFSAIHLDAGDLESDLLLDKKALQQAYRQAAQTAGVEITAIAPGFANSYGLTSPPDSDNARHCWRLIQIAIDAAAQMAVPLVFVPSFRAGEIRTEHDLLRTAEVLRDACAYAANYDLLVATENTLGVSDNLKLIEAVSHPKLRILMDTLNPVLWGHKPAAMIEGLWPYICHQIHAKDGLNNVMGNAVLGTGQADFVACVEKLRSFGFAGTVISENDYQGDRASNVATDIAVIAELFHQDN